MSNFNQVFEAIKDMILDVKDLEEEEITPDTTLEALDLDSLDFVQMTIVVKKSFGVAIQPEGFENGSITTLQETCDYVLELAGLNEPA